MSIAIKLATLTAVTLAFGASPGASPAHATMHCETPPGATRPICINQPGAGAAIGPVVVRPAQQPYCYYLPTVAGGAVNGLRKVCS